MTRDEEWRPLPGPVLLSAGFPADGEDVPAALLLEIEEATLSLCRAVAAVGGELAVPADAAIAPLVATVAAEYAAPPSAERETEPPPLVHVLMTEGHDEELELDLSASIHTHHWRLRSEPVKPGTRQRLTAEALAELSPFATVVLGGAPEIESDFGVLLEYGHGWKPAVIGPTLPPALRDGELGGLDVVAEIMSEVEPHVFPRARDDEPRRRAAFTPYPFVMQVLVERWSHGEGPGARPYAYDSGEGGSSGTRDEEDGVLA